MGLIKRLKRITSARVEAFLNTVEDPEAVFPQLVNEMEDKLRATVNAEAKARASFKSAQRRLDEAEGRVMRLGKGAELALMQGDEETAREALSKQVTAEKDVELHQEVVSRSESALEQAKEASAQLESELEKLKSRSDEIITRARSAKIRKQTRRTVSKFREPGESILDQISRIESRLDEDEAEREIRSDSSGKEGASLDERLRQFERESEIEARLAMMRKKKK